MFLDVSLQKSSRVIHVRLWNQWNSSGWQTGEFIIKSGCSNFIITCKREDSENNQQQYIIQNISIQCPKPLPGLTLWSQTSPALFSEPIALIPAEERGGRSAREAFGSEQWVLGQLSHAQQNCEICNSWTSSPALCKWRKLHPSWGTACRFSWWLGMYLHGPLNISPFLSSRWHLYLCLTEHETESKGIEICKKDSSFVNKYSLLSPIYSYSEHCCSFKILANIFSNIYFCSPF